MVTEYYLQTISLISILLTRGSTSGDNWRLQRERHRVRVEIRTILRREPLKLEMIAAVFLPFNPGLCPRDAAIKHRIQTHV